VPVPDSAAAHPVPFCAWLDARARATGSLLCVGLDPHAGDLPQPTAAAAVAACERLIAATAAYALAFKPNAAFFEVFGADGARALRDVVAAVPQGVPVILDAKRGDIASTAEVYAAAAFDVVGAHAVTVSPYLGPDAVAPFAARPERGVFLLCRTSNPGAAALQDLPVAVGGAGDDRTPLYEHLARVARGWSPHANLGLVVGATQPAALARVRAAAPDLWLLVPGVGVQGGDLRAALAAGLRRDGRGLLLNVSRALARAADPAAEAAALCAAVDEARAALAAAGPAAAGDGGAGGGDEARRRALVEGLLAAGCVQLGEFTLRSGLRSPVYLDLRRLVSHPRLLDDVAAAYVPLLRRLSFDRLVALPYAALPIGTAVALRGGWPLVYPRREAKDYGTRAAIEGDHAPGERAVVLDDLATTAGAKLEARERLQAAGLTVDDVVVLVDRESGAREALAAVGCRLHAVLTLTEIVAHGRATGRITAAQADAVARFVAESQGG
jgi:uridine monophosphate synthetase